MQEKNNGVSRDELDDYIHVAHMGIHIAILALVIILIGWIIWGINGKIPVTETVNGLVVNLSALNTDEASTDNEPKYGLICCLDAYKYDAEKVMGIKEDVKLKMPDGQILDGKAYLYAIVPDERSMVAETYFFNNEWLMDECIPSYYNWVLVVTTENDELVSYPYSVAKAKLVMDEVTPFSFLVR